MKIYGALVTFLAFFCLSANAQKSFNYQPSNLDSVKNYISTITFKKAKSFSGQHQKEISKILEERKTRFIESIADSAFIFDKRISNHLNSILRTIYTANSELNTTDYYFFLNKSPIPNAGCYGNGVFSINLGLIDLLDSDDEIAFVICHEIAHLLLKHNDSSLLRSVQTLNSKETKSKINKAAKQRYGRRQAVSKVISDLQYNFQKRSRSAEMQADSLGLKLFSRTKYNRAAAATALKKLDASDTLLFTTDTQIRKHFNFDTYPFKEPWLQRDETLFDLEESANDLALDKDSLNTHPDIPSRILKMALNADQTAPTGSQLAAIKKIIAENNIAISLDASRLDLALYQILSQYQRDEVITETYCTTVATLLKRTYELKSNHKFGKFIDPVSPFDDEKYLNEVRIFLHNIEMKNLRKIGLLFCQKHAATMRGNPEFETLNTFFTNLNI